MMGSSRWYAGRDLRSRMRAGNILTDDSPKIRVRELLTHTAGFVTDDPSGDRQTPVPEDEFTRLLRDGVRFTRAPAMAMEYLISATHCSAGSSRMFPGSLTRISSSICC